MVYVKINDTLYPATFDRTGNDREWDGRECYSITVEMDCATAASLFVDGAAWAIVQQNEEPVYDENGVQTGAEMKEYALDNSEYSLAGDITDHRDGTVTVKMGRLTELEEAYEIMLGGY